MSAIIKFFSWLVRGLSLAIPFLPALFGISVYVGVASALVALVVRTYVLIQFVGQSFHAFADEMSVQIAGFFGDLESIDAFQFFAYTLSLDVPINWLSSFFVDLIGVYSFYIFGAIIWLVEIVVAVLSVIWIRKRLKLICGGFDIGRG